jgi:mono/diheme cytochrome c family protein
LDGRSPGQSDGSGDLIPKLLQLDLLRRKYGPKPTGAEFEMALAEFKATTFNELPTGKATVTDILSTWRQNEHPLAQIDGTVKSPFYRNIAAILAVVGDPHAVNYENASVCANFLNELPPPAYPFDVDMRRASRGRVLFQRHCAVCHKPQNTVVYRARPSNSATWWPPGIGTDANRAEVLNEAGVALFVRYFRESVPTDYSFTDADGAKIRPRQLPDDSIIIDRSHPEDQGYVADALNGLWARGPYLHNGSVPTVRHLLVPNSRPNKFVRGSISFDQADLGWQWDPAHLEEICKSDPQSVEFDTHWDGASNSGHDRDLTVDVEGRIVRESWDEFERNGTWKVRLDWSGPEHRYALDDLLEYLKTL